MIDKEIRISEYTTGTFPKGYTFEVTSVDLKSKQFYSPNICWQFCEFQFARLTSGIIAYNYASKETT